MKSRPGFTLIELSIVLVIIGLIIGGVLAGKDLIHAAEVRKTISQIQATQTAINTFENKYNCLPGDCANASNFFSGAVNGDGDGQIACSATDLEGWCLEPYNLWSQLSAAGLTWQTFGPFTDADADSNADIQNGEYLPATDPQILAPSAALAGQFLTIISLPSNTYSGIPHIVGNYIVLSQFPYGDFFAGGVTFTTMSNFFLEYLSTPQSSVGVYPQDAFAIDTKLDDGLPLTGSISVLNVAGGNLGCTTVNGDNTYDMSTAGNVPLCVMLITLGQ